jgi:hypothetical protein
MGLMPLEQPMPARSVWLNRLLAVTVLLSAWLLFQVQPIVAKRILPWFGGGSAVWTATMLFFQTALFAGYLYAHLVARRLAPKTQALVHIALLATAAGLLAVNHVVPEDQWKPQGSDRPALHILAILAACVGPSYLMLASTAPLVQVWFSRANPGRSPYRLYALSNVGSLAALLSYPLAVEPQLGLADQGVAWSALFIAFAIVCAASAILSLRTDMTSGATTNELTGAAEGEARRMQVFFWLALPACAVVALLSITSYVTQNVAPIPLLWIAPMVVYLLTFILTFDSDRWYRRVVWLPLAAICSFVAVAAWSWERSLSLPLQLAINLSLLFTLCMVCHGELAQMRPAANRLTAYYLCIAAGGALGGLFTALAAPVLFVDHYELPLGMLAAWLLAIGVLVTDPTTPFYDGGKGRGFAGVVAMLCALVGLAIAMYNVQAARRRNAIALARNFYGVLKVSESLSETNEPYYTLVNGNISHGAQFRTETNRRVPMTYYHLESAVGQLLGEQSGGLRRIAVVGLGAGTIAAYANAGDSITFYEINPQVTRFADEYFTYLTDARERGAKVNVVEGDARLSLERSPPQNFDYLFLDAFSGDAIPVHLLTTEAFELYLRHLKQPDGVIAVHISNLHLELTMVMRALVERFDLEAAYVRAEKTDPAAFTSTWVLFCRTKGYFAQRNIQYPLMEALNLGPPVTWTDDYSNLIQILKD